MRTLLLTFADLNSFVSEKYSVSTIITDMPLPSPEGRKIIVSLFNLTSFISNQRHHRFSTMVSACNSFTLTIILLKHRHIFWSEAQVWIVQDPISLQFVGCEIEICSFLAMPHLVVMSLVSHHDSIAS
jgi:hypothetical protein